PVNCNLPEIISRSSPRFLLVTVSHVSPSGSTDGRLVLNGWMPLRILLDCEMLKVSWKTYDPIFPLPIEPYEARIFKSDINFGEIFQSGSCEILHPIEADGKNAYRSFSGNFEEPS